MSTAGGGLGVDDWIAHRPGIVRSVAARVPGIDAEEATSRALEKMVRIVSTGGTINDPAPYWRRAAVNEAISMTREAGRAHPVEDDTLDGLTPPAAGAELDAERLADVTMLRTALSDLADDDRQILLERHVHDKAVTDIATGLGVRPHAVTMRLRRAEERLAGAFAAAHAQAVNEPECRTTRAAMHDYLKGRLLPRRQRRLEVHMDGCTECTRAFIDVREVSWMLRDYGQHLIGGALVTGTVGGATAGTGIAVGAGVAVGAQPRTFGRKETTVAAGVLVALAIGGAAAAHLSNQTDQPTPQAVVDLSGGGTGPVEPPAQDLPPSIPPADPEPRPATTPKDDQAPALEPVTTPERDAADSAPAAEPEAEAQTEPEPALEPVGTAPEPEPADPPAEPAPEEPAAPPAPEPAPEPEPKPEPETPPAPSPPQGQPMSGPPGNPGNDHGKGPSKDNGQGPGNGNGHGHGKGPGNGNGKGHAPDGVDAQGTDLGEHLTSLLALPSIAGTPGVLLLDGLRRRRRRRGTAS
ncbi:RNA polymerase sigma factor [Promicromonospora panici]|uniref:RNA polymerase sigma factor n=1 Tax=Promicromonospora panici TaxID=2219658 RepID=UPI00101BAE7D|nr:sigma-70 family RNA polymerase sigma factor [Promicromonospora panici]